MCTTCMCCMTIAGFALGKKVRVAEAAGLCYAVLAIAQARVGNGGNPRLLESWCSMFC